MGREVKTFSVQTWRVNSVAFSPDNKYVLSGNYENSLELWDINSGNAVKTFSGHSQLVFSVALSQDGQYALSGNWGNTLKLWDFKSGKEVKIFSGHTRSVFSVAFSPDRKHILSGSRDSTLKLWDYKSGKELKVFSGHTQLVFSVAFSPNGKYALSGSIDSTLKLWNIESGKEVKTFRGHNGYVVSVAFSHDGKFALSGSYDETMKLWDINSGKEIKTFSGHNSEVLSVAFSPNGQYVLTGNWNNTLKLWDINSGNEVKTFFGHTGSVNSIAFSPDGKYAISGSWDNTLKLWDISSGKELKTFSGHIYGVSSVAFSPNGKYILSGSYDTKTKIWNVETGNEIASLISLDSIDWAVVTPEGQFDASSGAMNLMYWVVGMEPIDLEQLKERYYEPGLLSKLMGYNNEPLREVKGFNDIKLFPEIKLTPPSGSNKHLLINLTDRGGGIGKVKVLINGKELTGDARGIDNDFNPDEKIVNIKVDISKSPYLLPGTDNRIEVFAYNSEGYLSSRPVEVHYTPEGTDINESPEFYAIVAGVSDYEGGQLKLRYASKDAEDISKAFEIGAKKLFGENKTHIKIFSTTGSTNTELPTKQNITNAFQQFSTAKQNDVLVVYLSGHGINLGSGTDNEDFYYLTKEARTGNLDDPEIRKQTSISSKELTELLLKIPALKQVLILDVCGSGKVVDKLYEKRDIPSSQIRAFERMKDRAGLNILTGCASDAVSYEATKYAQGILTYSLLMGIKGGAIKEDGLIDVSRLFRFSEDEVPKLASNIGGIQQPKIFGSASFDIGIITTDDRIKIPLSTEKPLVLQSRFQDASRFIDHLGLEKKINEKLIEISFLGKESKIVFVDASEFPDAYSVVGQYNIKDNILNVDVKLFKGTQEKKGFKVTGELNKIDELVKKIIEETEKAILK